MESGDDGLESEANVRPRPCLTGAGSPGAQSTATDRGPSRQARLNRSAEGARTAYSARHTCPKTPETQSRNRSVRQAASVTRAGARPLPVRTGRGEPQPGIVWRSFRAGGPVRWSDTPAQLTLAWPMAQT